MNLAPPSPQDLLHQHFQSQFADRMRAYKDVAAKLAILNSELWPMRPSPKKTAESAFKNMEECIKK
jgi:hypothetical protein